MTAAPAAGTARARARQIDWQLAAELLAGGTTLAETARAVGCSARHLGRKRRHDATFQAMIAGRPAADRRTGERPKDHGGDRPEGYNARLRKLRRVVHEAIESEVREGNVRVILWLADRLKLVSPPDERTPDQELRHLLGGLSTSELKEFESLKDPD